MKKYISIFTLIIVFSLILCIPCFASDKVVTFSDDFQKLYYDGHTYSRVNTSFIDYSYGDYGEYYVTKFSGIISEGENFDKVVNSIDISLTEKQKENITHLYVNTSYEYSLMYTEIYYKDGSTLWVNFIRDDCIDEYNRLISGKTNEFTIDFIWPDGNHVTGNREDFLSGKKTIVDFSDLDTHEVYGKSTTGDFNVKTGFIFTKEDKYYFFSYIENNVYSSDELYTNDIYEIPVYEITNPELIKNIKEGEQAYFDDDFGYLYNDELADAVSRIIFTLILAIIPGIILVTTLIMAIKAKKPLYRKLLLTTSGLSLAEIAVFIFIAFKLFNA